MVSTVASQQGGPEGWGLSVGSLRVLQLPPTVQIHVLIRLIGESRLPLGVNGCLSLCVSPAMNWRFVQAVPSLLPIVSWDRLQPPATLPG